VRFGALPRVARPMPLETGTPRDMGLVDRRLLGNKLVVQVGVGAIGSWIDWFLASDGVRHFRVVDPDEVEVSNLYGRTAYRPSDVGRQKVVAISGVLRENVDPLVSFSYSVARTWLFSHLMIRGSFLGYPVSAMREYQWYLLRRIEVEPAVTSSTRCPG
jgi:hypothetical protein